MKRIITFFIIALTSLSINAQNFVEVKTNIAKLVGGGAVAWGDYDNDGDLDLFISGSDSLQHFYSKIYRNDNGIFTDIHANLLGVSVGAIADWGDYDNDGDLDLLLSGSDSTFTGQTRIYRNDHGTFTDIHANLIGLRDLCTAKWGDYNGDGKLDILLSGFNDDTANYISKIYKNVNDSFIETNIQLIEGGSHRTKGFVDVDGDGDLDVFIAGRLSNYASLYINNKGNFKNLTTDIENTSDAGSSDWVDFDNDGDLDLAIMGMTIKSPSHFISKIYRNNNNQFVDLGANLINLGEGVIKWVDFDMDGNQDIFISGMDIKGNLHCYLYRNDSGKFTLVPTNINGIHWPTAAFGDYNNDNATDFIITGFDENNNPVTKLYKNTTEKKLFVSSKHVCDTSKSAAISYVGDTSKIKSFQWNFDGGKILSGPINGPLKIKWNTFGDKNIQLVLINKSGINDTLTSIISVFPGISVSLGHDTTLSNGENLTLNPVVLGGTIPFTYTWNGNLGTSVRTFNITRDSVIVLKVQDKNKCKAQSSIDVNVPINEFSEQICLVTVDNISGKNKVVWEKTTGKDIKEYNILKETTIGGQYKILMTLPFNSTSIFVDTESEPNQHADRYILETIDLNGYKIGTSGIHQTIHLAISQGLPGTYNLIWTPYVGFDYGTYYIYKGTSPSNLKLIDSLSSTYIQYTDTAKSIAYYQIAVRKHDPCIVSTLKAEPNPYSQSVSNLEDNLKFVKISSLSITSPFTVHPNPFSNELIIEGNTLNSDKVNIQLFNLLGMKIYEESVNTFDNGSFKYTINTGQILKSSDINILRLETNGKIYFSKVMKK